MKLGILDKLMFWKKEEPFDMGKFPESGDLGMPGDENLGLPKMPGEEGLPGMPQEGKGNLGMPGLGAEPAGQRGITPPRLEEAPPGGNRGLPQPPSGPSFGGQQYSQQGMSNKDIEIISLKLDSLKTILEAINERIARLEKMAESGSSESSRW